jgi:hypothetical protein
MDSHPSERWSWLNHYNVQENLGIMSVVRPFAIQSTRPQHSLLPQLEINPTLVDKRKFQSICPGIKGNGSGEHRKDRYILEVPERDASSLKQKGSHKHVSLFTQIEINTWLQKYGWNKTCLLEILIAIDSAFKISIQWSNNTKWLEWRLEWRFQVWLSTWRHSKYWGHDNISNWVRDRQATELSHTPWRCLSWIDTRKLETAGMSE